LGGGLVDFTRYIVGGERLYPIGIPANSLFAVALGIAIVRYRLWDVSVLARKALLYVTAAAMFVPVVGVALYGFGALPSVESVVANIWTVAGFVLVVVLVVPIMRRLEQSFDRMMFARRHGVRDVLLALSRDMASILDLHQLGRTLTEDLVRRVPVMHAILYLPQGDGERTFTVHSRAVSEAMEGAEPDATIDARLALWIRLHRGSLLVDQIGQQAPDPALENVLAALERTRVALLVPLWLDGELAGILAVGEKVSGAIFDTAETNLLELLAGQTAIALKNASLYENVRSQMEELKATQQQLVQSTKLAAIGELAASVAHELNNPLTVILGNAQILLRSISDEKAAGKLSAIEHETQRAARIIRNLLDFSRKREPRRDPVGINDVVGRTVELIHLKLRGRDIALETVLEPRVPILLGDSDQLTQVLLNFIGNAIDAIPGRGSVTVATAIGPDGEVEFTVTDTGCGMTAEQAGRIFEPFFTTKAEGKGTGLGLSIALGIIRGHGGCVTVESEVGKGTTMRARLPVATPARSAAVSV
jgi:signal transduction histidine kinase